MHPLRLCIGCTPLVAHFFLSIPSLFFFNACALSYSLCCTSSIFSPGGPCRAGRRHSLFSSPTASVPMPRDTPMPSECEGVKWHSLSVPLFSPGLHVCLATMTPLPTRGPSRPRPTPRLGRAGARQRLPSNTPACPLPLWGCPCAPVLPLDAALPPRPLPCSASRTPAAAPVRRRLCCLTSHQSVRNGRTSWSPQAVRASCTSSSSLYVLLTFLLCFSPTWIPPAVWPSPPAVWPSFSAPLLPSLHATCTLALDLAPHPLHIR